MGLFRFGGGVRIVVRCAPLHAPYEAVLRSTSVQPHPPKPGCYNQEPAASPTQTIAGACLTQQHLFQRI